MSEPRKSREDFGSEPAQPLLRADETNPFRDIWEAKAFAVGNLLIKSGFMSRQEWVEVFSEEIKAAQRRGDEDRGDTYYSHWMHALERIAKRFEDAGATEFCFDIMTETLETALDTMNRFADEIRPKL